MPLTVHLSSALQPLPAAHWQRLFFDHPDPAELIGLVSEAGMDGFKFSSIVIKDGDQPIMLLPIFETNYQLATSIEGEAGLWARKLERYLPWLLKPRVIAVGFVEGEWGQVGMAPGLAPETERLAWSLALKQLDQLCRKRKAAISAFWNFVPETANLLPPALLADFTMVQSQPFSEFSIKWTTLDQYLGTLDSDMRRYLKRVLRNGAEIKRLRTKEPGDWCKQIYELYRLQVDKSEMVFGVQPYEYFARFCQSVPNSEYMLYVSGSQLIGFELLVRRADRLVMKYFGMHPELGPAAKLYFLSWLEQLQYCMQEGISRLHVGAASEGLKAKLGAKLKPSAVIFKHRNPLLNRLFTLLKDQLAYDSEVPIEWSLPEKQPALVTAGFE